MVSLRRAIESQYSGRCTVIEWQSYVQPNKITAQQEVVVLDGQPCKLSFETVKAAQTDDIAPVVAQSVKVFLSPELIIKPGSKLIITQNGITTDYMASGQPARYQTHQELGLVLFRGWA